MRFEFANYESRGCILMQDVPDINAAVEETKIQLNVMMSSQHVVPLKDQVSDWLGKMHTVAEVLEEWETIESMWKQTDSVYSSSAVKGGELAEISQTWLSVEETWLRVVADSRDKKGGSIIQTCTGADLKATLRIVKEGLERIQKSVTEYLTRKREAFPRFYLVSDPILLDILLVTVAPLRMQQHLPKLFDSISELQFGVDPDNYNSNDDAVDFILGMYSPEAEVVPMQRFNVIRLTVDDTRITKRPEDWLSELVESMRATIKSLLSKAATKCWTMSLEKLVLEATLPAQCCLALVQFRWADSCERAIEGTHFGWPQCAKEQTDLLDEMVAIVLRDDLSKITRRNVETLITVHVHQVEVIHDLAARKVKALDDFEWQKLCRFYWRDTAEDTPGVGDLSLSCAGLTVGCGYEYCGVKERLCVSPLTDRCYITLAQAMAMCLGGAPAGPAGTGKTETVKDFGRSLMRWVVVTNCSDKMDTGQPPRY